MPTIPTTVPMRRAKTRRFRSRGPGAATAPGALHEEPGLRSGGLSRVLAWVLLVAAPVAFAGVLYWSTLARPGPAQDPGLQAGSPPASAAAGAAGTASVPAGARPAAVGTAGAAQEAGTLAAGAQAGQPPASEPAGPGAGGATGTAGLAGQMPALDASPNSNSGTAGAQGAPEVPAAVPSSAALVVEPGQAVAAAASQSGPARRPPAQAGRLPQAANDGALLPNNASARVPPAGGTAPSTTPVVETVPVAQPVHPAAVPSKPASPRQTCGSRVFVALYRCMQRQCERPELTQHAECVEWRRLEEGNRGRR